VYNVPVTDSRIGASTAGFGFAGAATVTPPGAGALGATNALVGLGVALELFAATGVAFVAEAAGAGFVAALALDASLVGFASAVFFAFPSSVLLGFAAPAPLAAVPGPFAAVAESVIVISTT
jgi:hypothetical protein